MTARINGPVRSDTEPVKEALRARLFAEPDTPVYALLDGAAVKGLRERLHKDQAEHVCLYRGELEPDMAEVAPYLVLMSKGSPFTEWVLEQGWGNHWGLFVLAPEDLKSLRQHFRRLLTVHDSSGKPLLFRFYDPRVLRVYLPACNAKELAEIFGAAKEFAMEAEDPARMLRFKLSAGALVQQAESLTKAG